MLRTGWEMWPVPGRMYRTCRRWATAERSRQIDDIVEPISEISEQTNLLALKTAIKCRAGENGQGLPGCQYAAWQNGLRVPQEIAEIIQEILRYCRDHPAHEQGGQQRGKGG